MPNQKHLFDRVVSQGLYVDVVSVPSWRNGPNSRRYEVFNAKDDSKRYMTMSRDDLAETRARESFLKYTLLGGYANLP